jgi:hypothetical protein
MMPLHLNPLGWVMGITITFAAICLWWTSPAKEARRRQERLHRRSREVHPDWNRAERRAIASKRWLR